MSTISHLNTEAARHDPESVFADPAALVSEPGLTRGQKLAALKRWRENVMARLAAGSEGMPTHGKATEDADALEKIDEAMKALESERETDI